jgi:hypothetical protein
MWRNLGATRVATLSADSEARGYFYQWGRNDDGHEFSLSTTSTRATSITPATNAFITSTPAGIGAEPCPNYGGSFLRSAHPLMC